ncbi:ABC transporter ATP-binding protein [Haloferax mucosum ATCC BAA-1512]|uniref:ABC transporter ATP-binding protein n=1 Tax=Haloferax mucosum ATCC BAA-1512 TaxID=662479 RepID=M0IKI7_9EURY|nr:ABC transporter ATP-binding protein [Haloferax mucosum]ELZ95969.1 ABC transporter ATP-binding protein [Haloferax mucosum ATCC BAA-1512]
MVAERTPKSRREPLISVEGLKKEYSSGDQTVTAVDDISFSIDRGSIVGILGPNGAGKTTTIKSLLGLVEPDAGKVLIDGSEVSEERKQVYSRVSAMLEGARNAYWRLTVEENMSFFMSHRGINPRSNTDRRRRILEELGLADKANVPVRELSRGMKQKAALACVLAQDTPVLFLDEPTLGLDVEATRALRSHLAALAAEDGRTIIISSHEMDTVQELCDRVIVMTNGRIAADKETQSFTDLFQAQAYEIEVEDDIEQPARTAIERRFDTAEFADYPSKTELTVTLDHKREVFDLMDTFRDHDVVPAKVNHADVDLEEAYLQVMQNNTERAVMEGPTNG